MTLPTSPSLEEARAELATWVEEARTRWNTEMATANWTLPPTETGNRTLVDLGSSEAQRPFLSWEIAFGTGGQASLGPVPLGRQWGQLRLAAKVKEGAGTAEALRLLSFVIPFLEWRDGAVVRTQVASVLSGTPKLGWDGLVAVFTFWIDRQVLGIPAPAPTPAPPVYTWDPATAEPAFVLSNGNLTGSITIDNDAKAVTTTSRNSGVVYVEFVPVFTETPDNWEVLVGFGTSAYVPSTSPQLGSDAASWSHTTDGSVMHNNVAVGAGIPMTSGMPTALLLNFTSGKGWARNDTGWSGDPVAGTGEAFTFTPGTALWIIGCIFSADEGPTTSVTVNLGASACALTPPAISGLVMWDGSTPQ